MTFKPGQIVEYHFSRQRPSTPSYPDGTELIVIEIERDTCIRVESLKNGFRRGVYPDNIRPARYFYCI